MTKILITLSLCFFLVSPIEKLKPTSFSKLKIPEPSDIALATKGDSFFIVSDNGFLYETDLEGNIQRKADYEGYDFEGVYTDDNFVIVVEEMTRKLLFFDIENLKKQKEIEFPYWGGRNKGYEALTYNSQTEEYYLLTEKDPVWLKVLDKDFKLKNQMRLEGYADISAATFYKNHLWLLSDEDMTLNKINPETFDLVKQWKIPVLNPEGLVFLPNGELRVVADDLERLYKFSKFE